MLLLPRDAMLAWCLLSSCVRLSVHPSVRSSVRHKAGIVSKPLDESNRYVGVEAFFHLCHTVLYEKIWVPPKIRYFPLELCPKLPT